LELIKNEYLVTEVFETESPCSLEFSFFIHGLWLEGASWHLKKQLLEESSTQDLFLIFPVVRIHTIMVLE